MSTKLSKKPDQKMFNLLMAVIVGYYMLGKIYENEEYKYVCR